MGTKYRGGKEEVRALNAFITLMRAADAVSASAHEHLKGRGLTVSQFGALEALYHCGALCQGELASKLMRTMGSVTSLIAGLERRRLVRRAGQPGDKRFVTVELTEAGRRLAGAIMPAHAAVITRRFRPLAPAEQERLRALCRKLGKGRG